MTKFRKTMKPHYAALRALDPVEEMPSARSILKTLVFGLVLGFAVLGVAGLIAFLATR